MGIQKKKDNYFDINLRDHDNNFINNKSNLDIQKDAKKRIFKDMIYGNIDYDVYGAFFTNPNFVDILITTAGVESQKHHIQSAALDQFYSTSRDPIAFNLANQHRNCAYALDCIKYDLEMTKNNNYDIKFLTELTIQLASAPNCKKDYNEFY